MKRKAAVAFTGVAIVAAIAVGSVARSETGSVLAIILPQDIQWAPAPASLPCCAEAAVLYGDPAKEGLFALRVRIPKDYYIPPHTHPEAEVVTVLTGKFSLGMGPKADRASAKPIGAGGFMAMPPQVAHYVFSDEETVLQLTSVGPWAMDYVEPKDDPRLNIAPAQSRGSAQREEHTPSRISSKTPRRYVRGRGVLILSVALRASWSEGRDALSQPFVWGQSARQPSRPPSQAQGQMPGQRQAPALAQGQAVRPRSG